MTGRVQQLLAVVLAVDVQQLLAQLPELRDRHQPAIDPALVLAVSPDLPLEQQLVPLLGESPLLQPVRGQGAGEHRLHPGGLAAGANQLPAGPLA